MKVIRLEQIHIGSSDTTGINDDTFAREQEELRVRLLDFCPAHLWHNGSYRAACPRPILIGSHHQQLLVNLHEALTNAIIDIVQRWWSDVDANFPQRMPLEKKEEDLLKWLESQVSKENEWKFCNRLGSWRPDFLIEDHQPDQGRTFEENFRITEINARFSFNGFMHEAYGQQALEERLGDTNVRSAGLRSATDPSKIVGGLYHLFQPNTPLHLLKGREKGIDIHMFIDDVWRRCGIKPRIISPDDLRVLPDTQHTTGYRLCCNVKYHDDGTASEAPYSLFFHEGETLEEIYQVGLELQQDELIGLELEMLHQISLRCFNDMRTILLVHDKRMLGIVRQELQNMVSRQVISPDQAQILSNGIAETTLPHSPDLDRLIEESRGSICLKDDYLLKPIRGGKGKGIVFGADLSHDEWIASLERLKSFELSLSTMSVVQRRIEPCSYDLVLKPSGLKDRYPLVGTYHVVNGEFLGLGTWRASKDRIVAVSGGGSWICSVIHQQ